MNLPELPNELSERGIWWHVVGFAIAGFVSVAILQVWEGSDSWAYRSFETAVKDLYWLFILPLAGLIEGARKLFEKASEIRAAQREKIRERGRREGREEGRREGHQEGRKEVLAKVRERLQSPAISRDPETGAITLTPEDIAFLFSEPADPGA